LAARRTCAGTPLGGSRASPTAKEPVKGRRDSGGRRKPRTLDGRRCARIHPQANENAWLLGLVALKQERDQHVGLVGAERA
jgi:hypothetical protein